MTHRAPGAAGDPHRAELLSRGGEAFAEVGRGFVILNGDDEIDQYVTLEELREKLRNEPEMLGLLDAGRLWHDTYDPAQEVLVIDMREEAVYLLSVTADGFEVIGQVDFLPSV